MPEPQDRDLKRLEAELSGLVPRPANIDRDQLLFEAGRASVRTTLFWPMSALGLAVVAASLIVVLAVGVKSEPVVRFVHVPPAVAPVEKQGRLPVELTEEQGGPAAAVEPASESSLWRMHQSAVQMGVDQMLAPQEPLPAAGAAPAPSPIPTVGSRSLPATLAVTGDY